MRKGSTSFVLSILMAVLALNAALPLPADARQTTRAIRDKRCSATRVIPGLHSLR